MKKLKDRAPRNKTLTLSEEERKIFSKRLLRIDRRVTSAEILDKTINQDLLQALEYLPDNFVDLLFVDPPYNLNKTFNTISFTKMSSEKYSEWLDAIVPRMKRLLKPTASIYFCGDWRSSISIQTVLNKYFILRNRIIWEREKGRGAKNNWKNNSEDIWFYTAGEKFTFNVDAVKLKRQVIAPYKVDGAPKDWRREKEGNFRITFPSNIWTDISVPFWSMPENTEHPTQKPEKLLAKIILASSNPGDVVFDPFLGSGTTSVTAKKLGRKYLGVEIDREYALIAEKRLEIAGKDSSIQGYNDGVFWERNTKMNVKRNEK